MSLPLFTRLPRSVCGYVYYLPIIRSIGFIFYVPLMLLAASSVHGNVTSTCGQKEMCDSYLDLTIDMIVRAKHNIPTCSKIRILSKRTFDGVQPLDCADVLQMGYNKSGIYEIWPNNRLTEGRPLRVYCDMDTDGGGWTVVQRKGDFGSSADFFFQNWKSYKEGFGDLEKDFWLGNDNIFALTNQKLYSARFDLMDFDKNRTFAHYDNFWIDDESNKYTLHISIYSGNAGDSMTAYHDSCKFSTKDQENTSHGFVKDHKGAGWYKNYFRASLNGWYYKGKYKDSCDGIVWYSLKNNCESLEGTEIKVRPKNYNPSFESKIISF